MRLYQRTLISMKDISSWGGVAALLGWDQETMMPEGAAPARAKQMELIAGLIHAKATDRKLGASLRTLNRSRKLTADQRVIVREWLRDYTLATKLPESFVRELAKMRSESLEVWKQARAKSDFASFAPWLEKMIALKRRQAKLMGSKGHPYDVLLDDYEPGMTVVKLDPIIEELRQGLVPLAADLLRSSTKTDVSWITEQRFDVRKQEEICREVMCAMGMDPVHSRMDKATHPFCTHTSNIDVRITNRYDEYWFPSSIFGVIHESGHALYELGYEERHHGTPLAEASSFGVHESQSRLWENLVGRSRPFADYVMPLLKHHFPEELRRANADMFFRAVNRVAPTPIRVDADEVTYTLHIVLRYEIEKAFIAGEVEVNELPKMWNHKMKDYFGITPKNDAEGILQDIHWPTGAIGYFPTYLLGNLYAAQLWNRLVQDVQGVEKKIARGEFAPILAWLRRHIHRHGRRYQPAELIQRVTGKLPSPRPYLDYLHNKFGAIYTTRW